MAPSMESLNNRWRRKVFACFTSPADEDAPPASPPPSSDDECGRRRKTSRQIFSGSLKAAFCKSPLVKKFRTRKSKHPYKDQLSKHPYNDQLSAPEEIFQDNSDRSSLFSSSSVSCASSISSNSRSGSRRINESASLDLNQTSENLKIACSSKCSYSFATGMYVLLVCLVALVLGGKAFAIVTCTSMWLFFAPCGGDDGGRSVNSGGNVVESTEEYKKRVIMEGLLWRNRTRLI
ncbi:hypothetical protein ABFS82_13G176600 [Erythranthe guttata]|uniref:Uncharacterized protein n=1 Tax=Erythranthe guttata TaxID=4155 RepID=A0A022PWH8_ERYGU|nr:PREDICTED: uncharacterized protein LOC105948764 [Erythranthe guttata]EYU19173.1 hypothetical protein MIMGU_mgv1a013008mg [Erythranthe guttata]|eukprot:XP_012827444.1 PREDICTED: uncharacterized protein LOC105948764 [Erythranthe guttata]